MKQIAVRSRGQGIGRSERNAIIMKPRAWTIVCTVAVVLALGGTAGAYMFWVPVAGPMFKKPDHRYVTVKSDLLPAAGGQGSGTAKLDCNGGDDADRLVVKASGLPPNANVKVWFCELKPNGKRLGEPLAARTDESGNLKITVMGSLCYLKAYPQLIIVINDKVALTGDMRPPAPSPKPAGKRPFPRDTETPEPPDEKTETPAETGSPQPSR